jgi:PIN domain nuclease of toxin-antitoxin system
LTISPNPIEPIYAVDTNALIWYLTVDKRLSKTASAIFEAAEHGETRSYIAAIVVAELYYANKKWRYFDNFTTTYAEMKTKPYFRFVPLLADEVLDFDKDSSVPEMHDRMITGLARRLDAPLLTSDSLITSAGIARVIW